MAENDTMSAADLLTTIKYTKSKLAKIDEATEAAKYNSVKSELADLEKQFIEASLKSDGSLAGPMKPGKDYEWFQMRNAIATSIGAIPEFNGGGAVELCAFLEKLNQAHDTFCKDAKYEEPFMQSATMRLSQHVYSNLKSSNTDVSTFDKLKDWLKSTYDAQLTPYQLLGCAWDTTFQKEDKFVLYAQAVEKSMRTATKFIFEEHKKKHKTDMTAAQFSMLVSGMLLVEKLNHECPEIYRGLLPKIKDLTTATEVATHAETLRAQYGTSSQVTPDSGAFAERFRNQSRKPRDDNRRWNSNNKDQRRSRSPLRNNAKEPQMLITPSEIKKFMTGDLRLPDRYYSSTNKNKQDDNQRNNPPRNNQQRNNSQRNNQQQNNRGQGKQKSNNGYKRDTAHAENPNPPNVDNGTAAIPSVDDFLKADFQQ